MVKYRMTSKGTDGSEIYWDGLHYDAFNAPVHDDFKFYLAQAKKARGPVLELACGTGRLTIPLKKAGVDITGLDYSIPMLERAAEKAAGAGVKIRFLRGDARKFDLGKKFKLIFMAFHSAQHLGGRGDIEGLFASVARHLAPGGSFVLDVFNPEPHCLVRDPEEMLPVAYYKDPAGNGKILVNETYSYDKAEQVSRITWHYRSEKTGKTVKKSLNLRCFYPEELLALAHYNGFFAAARYGDFKGRPFSGASKEQILVLKKRPKFGILNLL